VKWDDDGAAINWNGLRQERWWRNRDTVPELVWGLSKHTKILSEESRCLSRDATGLVPNTSVTTLPTCFVTMNDEVEHGLCKTK
jgi:hypothetical protein